MENNIIFQTTTKTDKNITFRYPTIDDLQILTYYINKLSTEKTFINFQGEQQTLKEEKKWLTEKVKKIKKHECVSILAFVNNKLIGSSEINLNGLSIKHIGSFGITIDVDYRGEGIGKLLMGLVIKESIKNMQDLKIIKLECFASNPIAPNLYKKMGFIEYGRLPSGLKRQGGFVDEVLMYKLVK